MLDLEIELKNTFSVRTAGEDQFDFLLTLPKNFPFFIGHFPQFSVLPAVGLIDVSLFLVRDQFPHFKTKYLQKIKCLKIKASLGPNQESVIQAFKIAEHEFSVLWKGQDEKPIADFNFVFGP